MKNFKILLPLLIFPALNACDLYEESWTNKNKIQVEEERFYEKIPVNAFTLGKIDQVSKYYTRYGDGKAVLTITYDPKSSTYTPLKASGDMAKFVKRMRDNGVKNIDSSLLPVQEDAENVLISFTAYKAEAPKDCYNMPGVDTSIVERDPDYRLGCTVDTLFARQVSRPKDLKGQDEVDKTVDGRRVGNAIHFYYRDGEPNESLEGESASDD